MSAPDAVESRGAPRKRSGISALPTVYKRSAIVHITRIHSLMTLPVLFWRKEKELFCTVSKKKSKKKKSKAYLPTLFFSGKEPETQLFFFWPYLGCCRITLYSKCNNVTGQETPDQCCIIIIILLLLKLLSIKTVFHDFFCCFHFRFVSLSRVCFFNRSRIEPKELYIFYHYYFLLMSLRLDIKTFRQSLQFVFFLNLKMSLWCFMPINYHRMFFASK